MLAKLRKSACKSTTILLYCAEDYQRISINIEDPTRPLEWSHVLMGCMRRELPRPEAHTVPHVHAVRHDADCLQLHA